LASVQSRLAVGPMARVRPGWCSARLSSSLPPGEVRS
jgi:hypothetical protein